MGIKSQMEIELEQLLINSESMEVWDYHFKLLAIRIFRFREVSKE